MTKRSSSAPTASPRSIAKPRLLTDIPSVAALRDKVIEFENAGYHLLSELQEGARHYSRFGPPNPMDFPAYADRRRAMDNAVRAASAAAGEECPGFVTSAWSDFLEGFPGVFSRVHALATELLTMSPSQEFVVDADDTPVTQRLIPKLNGAVRLAISHVHPGALGGDGFGFFRQKVLHIPERFATALESVVALRVLLEAAMQPPRQRWPTGATAKVLKEVGHIGDTTFIEMCEEAGVKRGGSGSHAHRFKRADIRKLIATGRASESQKWNDAAESWAQEFGFENGG